MTPAVDFETLISLAVSGGDGKVACETTLHPSTTAGPEPEDLPAESFRIPAEQRVDWIDRNYAAPVYEREDSTKGPSNPKSTNHQQNHSTSQRFSGNLSRMDPILGLPRKLRIDLLGHSARHTGRSPRVIARKKAATVPDSEPVSPKVSCIGKVLSDRERGARACRKGRSLLRLFACCGGHRREAEREAEEDRRGSSLGTRIAGDSPVTAAAPPGIGAMRKFASGRSWASLELDDLERSGPLDGGLPGRTFEVGDVEVPGPLDVGRRASGPLAGDVGPNSA